MSEVCIISSSGGLDSTTLIYKVLNETKNDIVLVNFNYGQANLIELKAQEKIYNILKDGEFKDRIIFRTTLNLQTFDIAGLVNMLDQDKEHDYYTPSRNLLFSSIIASFGEAVAIRLGYSKVYLGLGLHKHTEMAYGTENKGNSQYWDITPEFAKRLQTVFDLNDMMDMEILAPYIDKFKEDIIKDVKKYNVPYKETWTCYSPVKDGSIYIPCLKCEACVERDINASLVGVNDINNYKIDISK